MASSVGPIRIPIINHDAISNSYTPIRVDVACMNKPVQNTIDSFIA